MCMKFFPLLVGLLMACSSTETSSSSSSGTSGTSGTSGSSGSNPGDDAGSSGSSDAAADTGATTNPGERCGYDKACVAAATNAFCAGKAGTKQYQCCKPAVPAAAAGCTAITQGTNADVASYCCAAVP